MLVLFTKQQRSHDKIFHIDEIEKEFRVQRRRIYDVLHVMAGAGLAERPDEKSDYRWVSTYEADARKLARQKLVYEEWQLDSWISKLKYDMEKERQYPPQRGRGLYMDAGLLKRHLFEHAGPEAASTQFVAIAFSKGDNIVSKAATGSPTHYTLAIQPPPEHVWEWSELPEGFKIQSPDKPLGYLAFAPPPPQLGPLGASCTSDFTVNALYADL